MISVQPLEIDLTRPGVDYTRTPSLLQETIVVLTQPEDLPMSASDSTGKITLFYAYSHKDEALRIKLEAHLSLLRREGVIQVWHDRKIGAGTEWEGQINDYLNSAHVILLLVSPDFVASDYCYDIEVERAMDRHHKGDARVIPVILRPVDS
jgi:hypothetical protein